MFIMLKLLFTFPRRNLKDEYFYQLEILFLTASWLKFMNEYLLCEILVSFLGNLLFPSK